MKPNTLNQSFFHPLDDIYVCLVAPSGEGGLCNVSPTRVAYPFAKRLEEKDGFNRRRCQNEANILNPLAEARSARKTHVIHNSSREPVYTADKPKALNLNISTRTLSNNLNGLKNVLMLNIFNPAYDKISIHPSAQRQSQ